MLIVSDATQSTRARTGLTDHLRRLDVDQSIFLRDAVMTWNRLSSAIARARRRPGFEARSYTAIRVEAGFRVYRSK